MKKQNVSPLFVTVWIIICSAVSFSLFQHVKTISKATSRLASMEEQTLELEKRNKELQVKISDAQSPFIREKMIRDQLGMQKPGEVVVQIVDSPNSASSTPDVLEAKDAQVQRSIFKQFTLWMSDVIHSLKEKILHKE